MAIGINLRDENINYEDDDIGPFSHLKNNSPDPTKEDFSNLLDNFFDKKAAITKKERQLEEDKKKYEELKKKFEK